MFTKRFLIEECEKGKKLPPRFSNFKDNLTYLKSSRITYFASKTQ